MCGERRLRRTTVAAWLRLLRFHHKVQRVEAEHLRASGLSVAQFDVLAHLRGAEGATQQELADALLVTKGNICQLLDRMERAGLLERRQDGRSNRLYLTPDGRALFDRVRPSHEALIDRQFSALSCAEQRQLHTLLRTLDRSLPP